MLLPIPYFHVVFTLPHELNPLIRANPRRLYTLLFQTVVETLQQFARDPKHLGAARHYGRAPHVGTNLDREPTRIVPGIINSWILHEKRPLRT